MIRLNSSTLLVPHYMCEKEKDSTMPVNNVKELHRGTVDGYQRALWELTKRGEVQEVLSDEYLNAYNAGYKLAYEQLGLQSMVPQEFTQGDSEMTDYKETQEEQEWDPSYYFVNAIPEMNQPVEGAPKLRCSECDLKEAMRVTRFNQLFLEQEEKGAPPYRLGVCNLYFCDCCKRLIYLATNTTLLFHNPGYGAKPYTELAERILEVAQQPRSEYLIVVRQQLTYDC